MSLEGLKSNIEQEKSLFSVVQNLVYQYDMTNNPSEKMSLSNTISSISQQMTVINNSIPSLLDNISLIQEMPSERKRKKEKSDLVSIGKESGRLLVILKKDKAEYLKQLQVSEKSLKEIGKRKVPNEIFSNEFKKPSTYVRISNKVFFKFSQNLTNNGRFNDLKKALIKGNFNILPNSYISVILFTTFLSLFVGIFLTIFLLFFNLSITSPFILLNEDILAKILKVIWITPGVPIAVFILMYLYPFAEKSSVGSKIDSELPFVTIQMSAIAGGDIEPSNIFKIIAMNKEYPTIRQEAKKIMNQINLYGYDLVNALRNVSLASSSEKWADLLNGFSSTIRSGGELSKYLDKKAENFLFEYRIRREKETKSAETFMNIYISIVIAAPMLLMLVLVMLNISGFGFTMGITEMTMIIVGIVSLINIVFLGYLQINKKKM
ncbi:MAG TPA: type II secretion system F family protein [Candidatus Paceibacterota bacterium]|nr:type II secretion system F family protein [Candidatus Paceibacterota bacterium]